MSILALLPFITFRQITDVEIRGGLELNKPGEWGVGHENGSEFHCSENSHTCLFFYSVDNGVSFHLGVSEL